MKALITGGAGFIGTHLAQLLRSQGKEVRSLDLKNPSRAVQGVEYVRGDVRDFESVTKAIRDCQVIFHFAAEVSVPVCQSEPLRSSETNLMGSHILAEAVATRAARDNNSSQLPIVFASSSAVYGELGNDRIPLAESATLLEPLSFYALQKKASESFFRLYCESRGLTVTALRFFNVYGPGQDPSSPYSGVISRFFSCALSKNPLILFNHGHNTRDFVHVADVAMACERAAQFSMNHQGFHVFNVGTGISTPISHLAKTILQITSHVAGSSSAIELAEPRAGDIQHSLANIQKISSELKFRPTQSLAAGLEQLALQIHQPKE